MPDSTKASVVEARVICSWGPLLVPVAWQDLLTSATVKMTQHDPR